MELSKGQLNAFQQIFNRFLVKLSSCDLCGQPCDHFKLLCSSCFNDLAIFKLDNVNGDLLNWPAISKALPDIYFDQLICLAPYLEPFNRWLGQFKYQGRFELAELFGHLLADHFEKFSPDINYANAEILSVPVHMKKWQRRGYNQAHLLAQAFAQRVSIPYRAEALIRQKEATSQVGQTGKQRRKNIRSAFVIKPDINLPEHIILIDDVVTTGATASEISYLLKQYKVKKVTVLSLCLTLP